MFYSMCCTEKMKLCFCVVALYEYKERIEKSLISLKNARATLLEVDDTAKEDLSVFKSNCDRQIKYLEVSGALNASVTDTDKEYSRKSSNCCHHCQSRRNLNIFQFLQAELRSCRDNTDGDGKTSGAEGHRRLQGFERTDPVLAPLVLLQANLTVVQHDQHIANHKVPGAHDPKENEAVQSPIAHVPAHPGQPSGNPNEDTAGNVLI